MPIKMKRLPVPLEPPQHAISDARQAAETSLLPQTIFWKDDGAGWRNTHTLSSLLHGAAMHMTVLPERYFECW